MKAPGRALLVLGAVAIWAGCSGGTTILTPRHVPTARPTGSANHTPTPSPAPSSGATLAPAAIATALQNVEASYQNLPHTNLVNDLNALATQMVSSKAYRSAVVEPGGIAAKLPDGTPVLIFADRPEDLGGASADARARAPSARGRFDAPISAPNAHEIAFLVNEQDTSGAFTPTRQFAYGNAFTQSGFGASTGYGVDAVDVTLANIASLGSGHPFDFLGMDTHGMIGSDPDNPLATNTYYAWLSTTPISAAVTTQYQTDYNAGNLISAIYLTIDKTTIDLSSCGGCGYAFTPTFLTEHVHFNPGAILDNQSCWGQNPLIASNVQGVLQAVGVGRYFGWTKEVGGDDADETDAFMFDRMLGEQPPSATIQTGLGQYANQRTPAQRPFPLDDIETAMGAENRNSPIHTPPTTEPYTQSDNKYATNALGPPIGDGTIARLVITDFGGESVADPPIEYSLPSISQLQVAESPANGTLTILGKFPAASGNVQITDSTGTQALTPTSWTTNQITATLPNAGNGSSGLVQVFYGTPGSGTRIASNPVPLTQWVGTVTYSENDTISELAGVEGDGSSSGSLQAEFDLTFRSDVHPTVPSIDASPVPQNLYFPQVEGNSKAEVTALTGAFTSAEGTPPPATAGFSLSSVANMTPATLPVPPLQPSTFAVGAMVGQPAPCNNGTAGPEGDAGNVFCPAFGYLPPFVGICSPDADDTSLCAGYTTFSPSGSFGTASLIDPGLVTFTMDPVTYAIAVSGSSTSFTRPFHGSDWPATASVTGTIGAPNSAPSTTTPAIRRNLSRQGTVRASTRAAVH